jgi:hypothetical protein
MRKKTKYHNTNGIVQVLKIRKKAWIALRLHVDNTFNLLAGTWQQRRHQSTRPPHSPSKKEREREKRKNWLRNLFDHITLRNKTQSFRSLLTPHLPEAGSSKSFSRTHLLWQTIRKRVRVCCDWRERKRSLLKPRAPSRRRTWPPRVRVYCDRQQGRGQKSGLQRINPTGPSEWLYKETPKKDMEDLAKSS